MPAPQDFQCGESCPWLLPSVARALLLSFDVGPERRGVGVVVFLFSFLLFSVVIVFSRERLSEGFF